MGRIRARPNNSRLEHPRDVATEAQIEDMFRTLNARVGAGVTPAGVSDGESPRQTKVTPSAGGGGQAAEAADLSDSPRPVPINGSGVAQPIAEHGVDKSRLPGADPAAVVALEWERVSPYAMRTLCRTWTCCKVIQSGQVSYELYRVIAGLERPVCVRRGLDSFGEAKKTAETEPG